MLEMGKLEEMMKKTTQSGKGTPFIKQRGSRDFPAELAQIEEELGIVYKRMKELVEKRHKTLEEYFEEE